MAATRHGWTLVAPPLRTFLTLAPEESEPNELLWHSRQLPVFSPAADCPSQGAGGAGLLRLTGAGRASRSLWHCSWRLSHLHSQVSPSHQSPAQDPPPPEACSALPDLSVSRCNHRCGFIHCSAHALVPHSLPVTGWSSGSEHGRQYLTDEGTNTSLSYWLSCCWLVTGPF